MHGGRICRPALGRPIVPPRGSEADDTREMRLEAGEIVSERFGPYFHQHLHVDLCFERIRRQTGIEFRILERGTNLLLVGACVDLGVEGPGNAEADALFTNAIGANNDK